MTNRNDGLADSLLRNISITEPSNTISKEEVKANDVKKVQRTNRFFKIDSELSRYFDFVCDVYDLNKTSDGIDFFIRTFREIMKDEVKNKAEEKQRERMEILSK